MIKILQLTALLVLLGAAFGLKELKCPLTSPMMGCIHEPGTIPQDECKTNSHCGEGQACCNLGAGCVNECVKGFDPTPREGECSADQTMGLPWSCRMDYQGCAYDSQCDEGEKCCKVHACGYKSCRAVKPPPNTTNGHLKCPLQNAMVKCNYYERNPPSSVCESNSDCGDGEACCSEGYNCPKLCSPGYDPTPRDGECPADLSIGSDRYEYGCLADYQGCAYDSECSDGEKCCETEACGYSQCKPILPPLNLECPGQKFWFCDGIRSDKCTEGGNDCGDGELCCYMECGLECVKGKDPTPKEGSCPVIDKNTFGMCIADYPGCDFDSDCEGDKKCCTVTGCGYKDCYDSA